MPDVFDQIHTETLQPAGGDVFDQIHTDQQGPPEQSFGEALREYGRKMNPVPMLTGIGNAMLHPIEFTKNWMAQNEKLAQDAEQAHKEGRNVDAARHAVNYLINSMPGFGTASQEAGDKLEKGDIAGGLADSAALASQTALGIKTPAIAQGAGRLTTAVGTGLKAAAPGLASGAGKMAMGAALGEMIPDIPIIGPALRYGAVLGPAIKGSKQITSALSTGLKAGRASLFPPPPTPLTPTPPGMIPWSSIIQKASEAEPAPLPASVTAELTRPSEVIPPPATAQPPAQAMAQLNTQVAKPAPVPIATRMANAARAVRGANADTLAQGLQDTGISADMADTIPRFKWRDIARAHGVDWPASSDAQFNLIRDTRAALRQRTTK